MWERCPFAGELVETSLPLARQPEVEPREHIMRGLPSDLPALLFLVLHRPEMFKSALPEILNAAATDTGMRRRLPAPRAPGLQSAWRSLRGRAVLLVRLAGHERQHGDETTAERLDTQARRLNEQARLVRETIKKVIAREHRGEG